MEESGAPLRSFLRALRPRLGVTEGNCH